MAVIGPKFSLCLTILSVWGIIQLALMGLLFHVHSVAFAEDLPGFPNEKLNTAKLYNEAIDKGYSTVAMNCWIAAGMYGVTFLLAGHQYWLNSRSAST